MDWLRRPDHAWSHDRERNAEKIAQYLDAIVVADSSRLQAVKDG
ncbi:hypothetical protein [Marinomonas primoryensis]|uniref:Uncharacterized protein n=1 Tax=Marinomonas primoryensis TaxID=178399 RepID=A0A859CRV9_9GAMM|nr:hypothetical protein [Marinomonas primoryensis]QKK78873.1 uncharacterized protein MP3633_0135 [Marinomonas primoryensis]